MTVPGDGSEKGILSLGEWWVDVTPGCADEADNWRLRIPCAHITLECAGFCRTSPRISGRDRVRAICGCAIYEEDVNPDGKLAARNIADATAVHV
jgi:hypothetical protein